MARLKPHPFKAHLQPVLYNEPRSLGLLHRWILVLGRAVAAQKLRQVLREG